MGSGSIDVLGVIWMPAIDAATTITLSDYDVRNIGTPISRETVGLWLDRNAGDFQSITDFSGTITTDSGETIALDWESEDNQLTWGDCMFPSEDWEDEPEEDAEDEEDE